MCPTWEPGQTSNQLYFRPQFCFVSVCVWVKTRWLVGGGNREGSSYKAISSLSPPSQDWEEGHWETKNRQTNGDMSEQGCHTKSNFIKS